MAELALEGIERHPSLSQIGGAGMAKGMGMNPRRFGTTPRLFTHSHPGAVPQWLTEAAPPETDEEMIVFQGGRALFADVRAHGAQRLCAEGNGARGMGFRGSYRDAPLRPMDVTEPKIKGLTDAQTSVFQQPHDSAIPVTREMTDEPVDLLRRQDLRMGTVVPEQRWLASGDAAGGPHRAASRHGVPVDAGQLRFHHEEPVPLSDRREAADNGAGADRGVIPDGALALVSDEGDDITRPNAQGIGRGRTTKVDPAREIVSIGADGVGATDDRGIVQEALDPVPGLLPGPLVDGGC